MNPKCGQEEIFERVNGLPDQEGWQCGQKALVLLFDRQQEEEEGHLEIKH